MLRDPKAQALVENFAGQWLQLPQPRDGQPRPRDGSPTSTSRSARRCARRRRCSSQSVIARGPQHSRLPRLPTTRSSTSGSPGTTALPASRATRSAGSSSTDRQRGGIMTQASILTVTSNPTRTSPVKRGKWILEQILGTPPPPPPPNVPQLAEDKKAAVGTLRQRMEQHRANPAAPPATRGWTRSASASRTSTPSAPGAPRTASRRSTPRASCPAADVPGPGRAQGDPQVAQERIRPLPDREAADLRSRPRPRSTMTRAPSTGSSPPMAARRYRFSGWCIEIVKSDPFLKRRLTRTDAQRRRRDNE